MTQQETAAPPVQGMTPTAVYWLPSLTFILHTLEELPDFPTWVSAHFRAMGVLEFAALHIPLILFVIWTSWGAQDPARSSGWRFTAYALQWQFAFNALFHLGAAALFQDYSPGMVTAATVAIPATVFMTLHNRRHGLLPPRRVLAATGVGAAIAAAAIGFLFI
jgi:hypothetical protein